MSLPKTVFIDLFPSLLFLGMFKNQSQSFTENKLMQARLFFFSNLITGFFILASRACYFYCNCNG